MRVVCWVLTGSLLKGCVLPALASKLRDKVSEGRGPFEKLLLLLCD